MKNKKSLIFGLILIMSIGFAAVTTTLIINGKTPIAENEEDYQVYFSGAMIDKEDYTNEIISKDKKTITFETRDLMKENDTSELTYEVTNGSTQYDASVKIKVETEKNELIEVTNTYDESKLSARETRSGTLTIKLKKGSTEEKNIKVKVNLEFNAEEREEIDNTPIVEKVYSISGYFVNKEGNAIPNADIAVFSETPRFVTTDDYGYFYVGGLERGNHELYYIEKSEVNKPKEEIKENAIDKVNVTTTHENEIIFEGGYEIKDNVVGEQEDKTIKVTLVKNNGEQDEEIEEEVNKLYINLPTPKKIGTKFLYWKDENGKIITDNTYVSVTTTNKLYACFEANTYKINYNLNGGVSTNTPTGATFDKDVTIANPTKEVTVTVDGNNQGATLTKTSYIGNQVFTGWTGSNLSNTALVNNVSWNGTLTKATTFKNLTSTLNGTVNLTANYNETSITLDTPTKAGNTCGYTDESTGSIKYTTSITVSDNKTIYVKCNPNTYTINFDSDGGTTVSSKTAIYDSKVGTLTNPTKTGYNFAGWYLDTESITSESAYKYAKDITLKAKWIEATNTKYTVNYYLQTLDKEYNKAAESVVYTGTTNKTVDAALKTYEGFVTPSKQTVKILADGSAKVDYYYVRKELKVTFVNDSTKKEVTYLYGKENQAFTNNGFTKTGYTLTGYSNTNGGSKNYEVTSTVTGEFIDKNYPSKTIYAVYQANEYKINYNINGGSGSMDATTCTYDKDCTLGTNTFTKTGYTFAGWSKTSGGEIVYKDKETVKNILTSGSITLYASWTANTYTVSYNANGGSGAMEKTTCTYDTNCTIKANSFTKTGYTFANWTKDSTSGDSYAGGSTVKNLATSGNINMYAKWNINTYTVTVKTTKMSTSSSSFKINYSGTGSITITPNSEYYISSGSCTNGYTMSGLKTGTSATSAQTVTINNNGKTADSTCTFTAASSCPYTAGTAIGSYDYSGQAKTLTVPCSGTYTLETYGAQGGNYGNVSGGAGGYAGAKFSLTKGEVLTIVTGGQNGYNGGGSASAYGVGGGMTYINSNSKGTLLIAGGGGGATVKAAGGTGGTGGGVSGNSGAGGQAGGGAGGSGGSAGSYTPEKYETRKRYLTDTHPTWNNNYYWVSLSGTGYYWGTTQNDGFHYQIGASAGGIVTINGENWILSSGLSLNVTEANASNHTVKVHVINNGIGNAYITPNNSFGWDGNGVSGNIYQNYQAKVQNESSVASKGGTNYINPTYGSGSSSQAGKRAGNGYAKVTLSTIN